MEQSKIDLFVATMHEKFSAEQMIAIRKRLENMDDSKFSIVQALGYNNPTTVLIVSLLAGPFGVDRFMLGQTGLGVLKLLTCGGFGIWTIIDWFIIMNKAKEENFQLFLRYAH